MSSGGRSERFAALGYCALAVFLTIILAWSIGYLNGRQAEQRYAQPHAHAESAKDELANACTGKEAAALLECVYEKLEASENIALTEQDLTAQQRAAWAALVGAGIALLTLAVSSIGVWFVKRTLDATLKAVEDTGLATLEMVRSNDIAERTSQTTLIAYRDQIASSRPILRLVKEETRFEFPPFEPEFSKIIELETAIRPTFTVENVGTQPCWIEGIWLGLYAAPPSEDVIVWPTEIPDQFKEVFAGFMSVGEKLAVRGGFWHFPKEIFKFYEFESGAAVIVYGMCQYRSPAQHIFTTRFAFHLRSTKKFRRPEMPLEIQSHWKDGRVKAPKSDLTSPIEWLD